MAATAFLVDSNSTPLRSGISFDSTGAPTLHTHDSMGAEVQTVVGSGGTPIPVAVTGTPGVGNTFTASLSTGWSATGYQWNRNGAPITGATSSTYVQVTADAGNALSLTVNGLTYTAAGITVPSSPTPSPGPGPSPSPSPAPAPAPGLTIPVTSGAKQLTLTSTATATAPFTAGYAFVQGDIPAGSGVVADAVTNLQVTPMNAWPDGSLKFAILSGAVALTANTPKTVTLSLGTSATGTALTTTNLKATSITASIACGSFGTVSWATTDWDTPFVTHVSGPQMSSWIYRKPVGSDAHLVAWLEVRLYAGGFVEVLPWIENGYLHVASPVNKAATYSFTLGGTQRSSQTIDLPARCRTPLLSGAALSYWLGADPSLTMRHDVAYLQSTEVVPPYLATVASNDPMVTSLPATFTPLQQGSFAYSQDAMESTGFASPIGLLPQHDVLYLTSNAPSIYASVVRNGYSAGRYPIHFRDESTNRPLKFSDHPNTSSNYSSTDDLTAVATGTAPPDWDQAHHPSVGFMAYLLTGRYYFIEEVQFAATANYLGLNDVVRGGVLGYTVPVMGVNQVRQAAWNTRTLMTACAITPDADTAMHNEYVTAFTNTITKYYTQYVAQPNNPLGFIQSDPDYTINLSGAQAAAATGFMAPTWQHDFFTATIGWSLAAGLPISSTAQTHLAGVFAFVAKSAVGRLGATNTGTDYLFTEAGAYFVCCAASHTVDWDGGTGPWLADWNHAYQITKTVMSFYSPPAVFKESTTTLNEISTPEAGGYFANLLPAIAYAVRHGVAGASAAWTRLTNATGWSELVNSFNTYSPVWGVTSAAPVLPDWVLALAVDQWGAIPNSVQAGSAADIDGGISTNSRLAYSSFVVKGTEIFLTATGGHGDYSGNEVVSIDLGLNAPAWTLRCARSATISPDVTYEPDGKPAAAHRYWGGFWSKETGRIIQPYTRFTWPNATVSNNATNGFNPVTNTWDAAGTWTGVPLCDCMDEDGNIWAIGDNYFNVVKFVPSTNTVTTLYTSGTAITASPTAFDSKRKTLYSLCNGDGQGNGSGITSFTVNRSTGVPTPITFNASAAYTQFSSRVPVYMGMDYDPVNDCFLAFCPYSNVDGYAGGDTTVYKITPNGTTVWDMSILAVTGLPPSPHTGSMTRFKYVAALGGFACMPSGTGSMSFLRTTAATVVTSPPPSPTPSPPPPTPTPPPSPTPPSPPPSPTPSPPPAPTPGLVFLGKLTDAGLLESVSGTAITTHGTAAYTGTSPGPAAAFSGASTDYLSFPGLACPAYPYTMGVFFRQKSAVNIGSGLQLMGLNIDSGAKFVSILLDSGYGINGVVRNYSTTAALASETNSAFAYDAWQMAAIVVTSATSRQIYAQGVGLSSASTTAVDTSGTTATVIFGEHPVDGTLPLSGFEKYGFLITRALAPTELNSIAADPTTLST